MNDKLITIVPLAKRLGVSVKWLMAEAHNGNIPHIDAEGKLLFNYDAVNHALLEQATRIKNKNDDTNN